MRDPDPPRPLDAANAFADGRYAIMTTKMLGFVQNDDELAVIMAHEAAHNLLGHPARLDDEKVPHGILRNFGSNAAKSGPPKKRADRLGIKLLWAAGYNVNAAIPFGGGSTRPLIHSDSQALEDAPKHWSAGANDQRGHS
jgi:predicted Zn-dependent protease